MYYVAYGSNLNIAQMKKRCPSAEIVGTGHLKNWRLVFNIHLDIIPEKGKIVPVAVWEIKDKNDWKNLDRYEGYPDYYIRKKIKVKMDDGNTINGTVYIMTKERKGICPPYEIYYDVCKEGYKDFELSTRYLNEALIYSFDNETEYNKYSPKDA